MGKTGIDIFLSHSSKDLELAKALADLFAFALTIPANRIRCTSVAGYGLAGGADTDTQLRNEIKEAPVLVGLITDVSVESLYVLFELGARWGTGKKLVPVLGAGASPTILMGPLSGMNALSCGEEGLLQLLAELAVTMSVPPPNSALVLRHVKGVVAASESLAEMRRKAPPTSPVQSPQVRVGSLSTFESTYLLDISKPLNEGAITTTIDRDVRRDVLPYREALKKFCTIGLMESAGAQYLLTSRGWELSDALWRLRILDELVDGQFLNEKSLATNIGLTTGESDLRELDRILGQLHQRGDVTVFRSSEGNHIQILPQGLTTRRIRKLPSLQAGPDE